MVHRLLIKALCGTFMALYLAGCSLSSPKPEIRFVSVPSSKPYRYIKYTPQCDAGTIRRLKVHNQTHWQVKQAEKKAAEQK